MKVKTHVKLGELMLNNIDSIPEGFSKSMFNFGLIMVDESWHVKVHPHFRQKSFEYIIKKVEKLFQVKRFNRYTSMELGIVVHYLCDFCCHAHMSGSIGNVFYHIQYELDLQQYLLEHFDYLKEHFNNNINNMNFASSSTEQIKTSIGNILDNYCNGEASYLWDIEKCMEVTSIVCNAIFVKIKSSNSIEYPIKQSQKEFV